MSAFRVGDFVQTTSNRLGLGKVAATTATETEVEYFDSVGRAGRHTMALPTGDLAKVVVSLQRRCYWRDADSWRVGRVVWHGDGEYGVRTADSDLDVRLPESEIYVRWDRPIEDPIEVLIAHGNESPHFHACRQPFIESIIQQRASSPDSSRV